MQSFLAVLMSVAVAASVPLGRGAAADPAAPADGEAYVAELDADWNVTREVRAACPIAVGCAVDLALDDASLAAVHVRFASPRAGTVAVRSRTEDRSGRASAAEDAVLPIDRSGFGAAHYAARATAAGEDGRIIVVAVRVPGWTAPAPSGAASPADRT